MERVVENILVYSSKTLVYWTNWYVNLGAKKIKKSTQATNLTGVNKILNHVIIFPEKTSIGDV